MKAAAVFADSRHKSPSESHLFAPPGPARPAGKGPVQGCGRHLTLLNGRRRHQRTGSRHLRFQCPLENCARPFFQSSDLQRHMLVHSHEKKHICPVPSCGKRFRRMDEMQAHARRHCAGNSWICRFEGCTSRFTLKACRQLHEQRHSSAKPYICPAEDCGKRFSRKDHRHQHWIAHGRTKSHLCPVIGCGKRFVYKTGADKHLKAVHGIAPSDCAAGQPEPYRAQPGYNSDQSPFACTRAVSLSCPVIGCDTGFLSAADQRRHLRTHTGEKVYSCPFAGCGGLTGTLSGLKMHQHIHTRKQPPVALPAASRPRESLPAPRPDSRPKGQSAPPLMCLPDDLVDWLEQQPAIMPSGDGPLCLFSPDEIFEDWGPAPIPSPGAPVPPDGNPGSGH